VKAEARLDLMVSGRALLILVQGQDGWLDGAEALSIRRLQISAQAGKQRANRFISRGGPLMRILR
jgi:hypothetical protein